MKSLKQYKVQLKDEVNKTPLVTKCSAASHC